MIHRSLAEFRLRTAPTGISEHRRLFFTMRRWPATVKPRTIPSDIAKGYRDPLVLRLRAGSENKGGLWGPTYAACVCFAARQNRSRTRQVPFLKNCLFW